MKTALVCVYALMFGVLLLLGESVASATVGALWAVACCGVFARIHQ